MPRPAPETTWRSRAFGLELTGDFPAPGLAPADDGRATGPPTRVAVVPADEIGARWPAGASSRLLEERFPPEDDQVARSIDHAPGTGYRLFARHFGLAFVSEDGAEVLCAPPDDEPWSWQRFLVGRILPWAAVLRGREVLHASAVTLDGRALAFVGPTGAGKSSLAIELVRGGAGFLTDDVLALERSGDDILAHPGAAIVSLRDEPPAGLGEVLGHSGKTYLALDREPAPVPLAALCFVSRADGPVVERIERPDARLLLGATFNQSIRTPARMRRQLELCADLASSVPMFRLRVAAGIGAAELADEVRRNAWR
jgi:hypothetical protein